MGGRSGNKHLRYKGEVYTFDQKVKRWYTIENGIKVWHTEIENIKKKVPRKKKK